MSSSQWQTAPPDEMQAHEMSIDPQLLAIDAKSAAERADKISRQDAKLQALEILLPGIGQYLAEASGDPSSRPGNSLQPKGGNELTPKGPRQPALLARAVTQSHDQTLAFAQRNQQHSNSVSGQEEVDREQIRFEVADGEAQDTGRSEYLAWLSAR